MPGCGHHPRSRRPRSPPGITSALSSDFIGYLNFLLGLVEPHPSEAELYERFARIGIGAGRRWHPEVVPGEMLAAIQSGIAHGLSDIDERVSHTTSSIGLFGSRQQLGDDYLTRAVAANMSIYGQVAEEPSTAAADWTPTGTSWSATGTTSFISTRRRCRAPSSSGRSRSTNSPAASSPRIRSTAPRTCCT